VKCRNEYQRGKMSNLLMKHEFDATPDVVGMGGGVGDAMEPIGLKNLRVVLWGGDCGLMALS
jgi:hypothetical protein